MSHEPHRSFAVRPVRKLLKDSNLPVLDWWDHDTNDVTVWNTVTIKARREVSWRCPECDLQFSERILDMVNRPRCPDCAARRKAEWDAEYAHLKATPIADVPELAEAWADQADPQLVTVSGHGMTLRRFRCREGHHPRITPLSFLRNGCPSCRGNKTRTERLEAVAADPTAHAMNREIASQWHYEKNGAVKLETISPGSRRNVWWKSWECGHEWQATPAQREKGQRLRCPECRTILDSLAYHFPERLLVRRWSLGLLHGVPANDARAYVAARLRATTADFAGARREMPGGEHPFESLRARPPNVVSDLHRHGRDSSLFHRFAVVTV